MIATANPNATKEARKLLEYLHSTAGKGIITGQHTQTNPMEEIAYIRNITGKCPKLQGFELLAYSPNINYDDADNACLTEVYENRGTVDTAIRWAKETNGIVTLTFHWFSPIGGRDKSFYTECTDYDPSQVLIEGTPERKAFFQDMDVIAKEIKRFQDENIPILWRPFHESDGTWFWWGRCGIEVARDLYRLMFDYYTNTHHFNHLLWVWNGIAKEGYPGDDFVDVVSLDTYLTEYKATDYQDEYLNLIKNTSNQKVAALAEVGYLPDIHLLEESHIPWAYYMTWSGAFCIGEEYNSNTALKEMYNSKYAITL